MHACGADALRERGIGADQQRKSARPARASQAGCNTRAIGRAEMSIDHGASARQARGDGDRIGCAGGIGEKIERRYGGRARGPVEALSFSS